MGVALWLSDVWVRLCGYPMYRCGFVVTRCMGVALWLPGVWVWLCGYIRYGYGFVAT